MHVNCDDEQQCVHVLPVFRSDCTLNGDLLTPATANNDIVIPGVYRLASSTTQHEAGRVWGGTRPQH